MPEPHDARPLAGTRIAHLGRQPRYTRDRIVAKALERAGAEVITVADPRRFPQRWPRFARVIGGRRFDAVLVSTLSHADVPLTRMLVSARHTPVVFDASIALYESMVESRGTTHPGSLGARRLALQDRLACRLADHVLVDTATHQSYLQGRTGVPSSRFSRVWLGADDEVMSPRPQVRADGQFRVLFYATYSPLHGAEHIVAAAAEISRSHDDIEFLLVGSGHTDRAIRKLAEDRKATKLRFSGRVPYAQLPDLIASSDVCLGVFGSIAPAARVIPFKVYDGLAMARPVVTADTPAAREALVDRVHCRLCPAADPAALAEVLIELKRDTEETRAIAERGHQLFRDRFSLDALSVDLGRTFATLLHR